MLFLHRPQLLFIKERALNDLFSGESYIRFVLEKAFGSNRNWGKRDRAAVSSLCYFLVRWKLRIGWVLEVNLSDPKSWPLVVAFSMRMIRSEGASQELHRADYEEIQKVWPHFEATKEIESKLRSAISRWTSDEMPTWARHSCGQWLDEFSQSSLKDKYTKFWEISNQEAPVFLRTNTALTTAPELQQNLEASGISLDPVSEIGFRLKRRQNVFVTPAFKAGLFEVQDGHSQLIAPLLEIKPGMRVMDGCAGAGGKTLHLSNLMKNQGKILACDPSKNKIAELKLRLRRAKVDNVEVHHIEDEGFLKRHRERFDALLLDVPCTGSGVFRRNPEAKYSLCQEDLERLISTQRDILEKYSKVLKPGGKLLYSTCSVFDKENLAQINEFVDDHPEWSIDLVESWLPSPYSGDGFFAARLIRSN
ncbi:MAG: hypothetical protein COT74_02590 [Bdellovibrionales bacterium CG10_big_fil_rev_8_21_14_0_10_45_34]|nr:MAG: hypothetical protein COT74_02590 [Bdellovibrionales bacterium CG10_big_fil_rev_8_21_14_0_10_45_34]